MISTKSTFDLIQEKEIGKSGNITFLGVTMTSEEAFNNLIEEYEDLTQVKVSDHDIQELRAGGSVGLRLYYKEDVIVDADIFDPYRHLEITKGQYIQPSGWTHRVNQDFLSLDEDEIE